MVAGMRYERRFASQRGLTLVEIMVVVAILAIIAAIAIPVYSHYIEDAKIGRAESNLVLLSTLMERYYQNNNAYPSTQTLVANAIPGWNPGNNPSPLFTYAIQNPDTGVCNVAAPSGPSYSLSATPTAASGLPTNEVFYLDSLNDRCEVLPNGTTVVGW
ncbi:MAG: type IV pilin protein [Acidiferrobacter thiooxydans]